jgi:hypothetical protein
MEQAKFDLDKFAPLIASFGKLGEAATEAAKSLTDFFESHSLKTYQKLGYPLGKSNRGFKKWQSKVLFAKSEAEK